MRAASFCIVFGLAAPILSSPTTATQPATVGHWQPLESQKVVDLEVVYGKDVKQLFKTPWNTWVANVDVIFPESTYTVPYMATLPTAAIAASISWSAASADAATTTMFLKVPEYVISNDAGVNTAAVTSSSDAMPTTTRTSGASSPPSLTSSTTPTTTSTYQRPKSAPSSAQSSTASPPSTSSTTNSPPTSTSTSASTFTFTSNSHPTFGSTSDVTSTSTSASASTSAPVPSPTSGSNSASTSSSTPSPRPSAGKVGDVCDSCSLDKPDASTFSCICQDKKVTGDLNDYLLNQAGVLKVSSHGNYLPTCPDARMMVCPGVNDRKIFCFFAACYTGGESPHSVLLAGPIPLGDVLHVDVSGGEFRLAE